MTLIYGIIECILYQTLVVWNEWLGTFIFLPLWTPLNKYFVFLLVLFYSNTTFFFHYVIVIKYFANVYCL